MPIKVLIVDDSVVVRRVVAEALAADPDIDVVGQARNGRDAVAKVAELRPDVVTMDVEMPEMDGIAAVRAIRSAGHRVPVIMFSTLTERGAEATFDALAAGATDYITKPSGVAGVADSIAQVRAGLIPRIRALTTRPSPTPRTERARRDDGPAGSLPGARVPHTRTPGTTPGSPTASSWATGSTTARPLRAVPPPAAAPPATPAADHPVAPTLPRFLLNARARARRADVVAIGCSTGGPEALTTVLQGLPADLDVPVLVVQHMPPVFTAQFAARLDRKLPFRVLEAPATTIAEPGTVYIAPGDFHLEAHRSGVSVQLRTTQAPPENFCRPAVDVLFRTTAAAYGAKVLSVVLTGMGHDGTAGARDVAARGGTVLAQDQATSVVWGMPGAVATAGLADDVLPLSAIAPAISRAVGMAAAAVAR